MQKVMFLFVSVILIFSCRLRLAETEIKAQQGLNQGNRYHCVADYFLKMMDGGTTEDSRNKITVSFGEHMTVESWGRDQEEKEKVISKLKNKLNGLHKRDVLENISIFCRIVQFEKVGP